MSNGFVVLHRAFMEWEWYDNPNVMRLFLHLILKANHKDKKWRGIAVQRGQVIVSLDKLSSELGLSVQQIRTAIKKLKSTGEIASQSTNNYTLVTLVNYDKYQKGEPKATSEITSEVTNEQQTDNKRITTTNNDNNDNNENNQSMASRFSIFLNKRGIRTTPQHPELLQWDHQGVTITELESAFDKALKAKPALDFGLPYLRAIIFRVRAELEPKKQSEADKAWERLFKDCICAPKLISDVFGAKAGLVKKAIQEGTGKQLNDLKLNTPEFNQRTIKKQFIGAYQQLEGGA